MQVALLTEDTRGHRIVNTKPPSEVERHVLKQQPYSEKETFFWNRNDVLDFGTRFWVIKPHTKIQPTFWNKNPTFLNWNGISRSQKKEKTKENCKKMCIIVILGFSLHNEKFRNSQPY